MKKFRRSRKTNERWMFAHISVDWSMALSVRKILKVHWCLCTEVEVRELSSDCYLAVECFWTQKLSLRNAIDFFSTINSHEFQIRDKLMFMRRKAKHCQKAEIYGSLFLSQKHRHETTSLALFIIRPLTKRCAVLFTISIELLKRCLHFGLHWVIMLCTAMLLLICFSTSKSTVLCEAIKRKPVCGYFENMWDCTKVISSAFVRHLSKRWTFFNLFHKFYYQNLLIRFLTMLNRFIFFWQDLKVSLELLNFSIKYL